MKKLIEFIKSNWKILIFIIFMAFTLRELILIREILVDISLKSDNSDEILHIEEILDEIKDNTMR